jgi:cytochrome bd ubiquinol oxidase subunit I
LLIIAPAQAVIGDFHGLNTLEHQPVKVAAMEGNWETGTGVPLLLFAWPDQAAQANHLEVSIPKLASFILTHDWDGEVPGMNIVPVDEQPPVAIVFWAFRLMVAIGVIMIGFAFWGLWLRWKGRLYDHPVFLRSLSWMIGAPFVAVLAGWFVTEVGRVPWLVYGLMTQAEGLTPSLTGGMALFTLIGYVVVYAIIFAAGIYYLTRIVHAGMDDRPDTGTVERPSRPLSAAHIPFDDAPETAGR